MKKPIVAVLVSAAFMSTQARAEEPSNADLYYQQGYCRANGQRLLVDLANKHLHGEIPKYLTNYNKTDRRCYLMITNGETHCNLVILYDVETQREIGMAKVGVECPADKYGNRSDAEGQWYGHSTDAKKTGDLIFEKMKRD